MFLQGKAILSKNVAKKHFSNCTKSLKLKKLGMIQVLLSLLNSIPSLKRKNQPSICQVI